MANRVALTQIGVLVAFALGCVLISSVSAGCPTNVLCDHCPSTTCQALLAGQTGSSFVCLLNSGDCILASSESDLSTLPGCEYKSVIDSTNPGACVDVCPGLSGAGACQGSDVSVLAVSDSSTPTSSMTPSVTASNSASPSLTATTTATQTPTATITGTRTASVTASQTPTASVTLSVTPSSTPSRSGSQTQSSTPSPSNTVTISFSPTVSSTLSVTTSVTSTVSNSYTYTASFSISTSNSPSISTSFTQTATNTPTSTVTPSQTSTASNTVTASNSASPSYPSSVSVTITSSVTTSTTPSRTFTPSATISKSQTATTTLTPSRTPGWFSDIALARHSVPSTLVKGDSGYELFQVRLDNNAPVNSDNDDWTLYGRFVFDSNTDASLFSSVFPASAGTSFPLALFTDDGTAGQTQVTCQTAGIVLPASFFPALGGGQFEASFACSGSNLPSGQYTVLNLGFRVDGSLSTPVVSYSFAAVGAQEALYTPYHSNSAFTGSFDIVGETFVSGTVSTDSTTDCAVGSTVNAEFSFRGPSNARKELFGTGSQAAGHVGVVTFAPASAFPNLAYVSNTDLDCQVLVQPDATIIQFECVLTNSADISVSSVTAAFTTGGLVISTAATSAPMISLRYTDFVRRVASGAATVPAAAKTVTVSSSLKDVVAVPVWAADNLECTTVSDTSVSLTWNAAANSPCGPAVSWYIIERDIIVGGATYFVPVGRVAAVAGSPITYVVSSGLIPASSITFRVVAVAGTIASGQTYKTVAAEQTVVSGLASCTTSSARIPSDAEQYVNPWTPMALAVNDMPANVLAGDTGTVPFSFVVFNSVTASSGPSGRYVNVTVTPPVGVILSSVTATVEGTVTSFTCTIGDRRYTEPTGSMANTDVAWEVAKWSTGVISCPLGVVAPGTRILIGGELRVQSWFSNFANFATLSGLHADDYPVSHGVSYAPWTVSMWAYNTYNGTIRVNTVLNAVMSVTRNLLHSVITPLTRSSASVITTTSVTSLGDFSKAVNLATVTLANSGVSAFSDRAVRAGDNSARFVARFHVGPRQFIDASALRIWSLSDGVLTPTGSQASDGLIRCSAPSAVDAVSPISSLHDEVWEIVCSSDHSVRPLFATESVSFVVRGATIDGRLAGSSPRFIDPTVSSVSVRVSVAVLDPTASDATAVSAYITSGSVSLTLSLPPAPPQYVDCTMRTPSSLRLEYSMYAPAPVSNGGYNLQISSDFGSSALGAGELVTRENFNVLALNQVSHGGLALCGAGYVSSGGGAVAQAQACDFSSLESEVEYGFRVRLFDSPLGPSGFSKTFFCQTTPRDLAASTPRIVSAKFVRSGLGSAVVVELNRASDRGMAALNAHVPVAAEKSIARGRDLCRYLFNDATLALLGSAAGGSDSYQCEFADANTLWIQLGAEATLVPGDSLTLRSNALVVSGAIPTAYFVGGRPVEIPAEPIAPIAVLQGPSQVSLSSCQTDATLVFFNLDASSSFTNGREPLSYQWFLDSDDDNEIAASFSVGLQNALQSAASAAGNNGKVRLPINLLTPGLAYRFRVRVTNFFGFSSDDSHTVRRYDIVSPAAPVSRWAAGSNGDFEVVQSPAAFVSLDVESSEACAGDSAGSASHWQFVWQRDPAYPVASAAAAAQLDALLAEASAGSGQDSISIPSQDLPLGWWAIRAFVCYNFSGCQVESNSALEHTAWWRSESCSCSFVDGSLHVFRPSVAVSIAGGSPMVVPTGRNFTFTAHGIDEQCWPNCATDAEYMSSFFYAWQCMYRETSADVWVTCVVNTHLAESTPIDGTAVRGNALVSQFLLAGQYRLGVTFLFVDPHDAHATVSEPTDFATAWTDVTVRSASTAAAVPIVGISVGAGQSQSGLLVDPERVLVLVGSVDFSAASAATRRFRWLVQSDDTDFVALFSTVRPASDRSSAVLTIPADQLTSGQSYTFTLRSWVGPAADPDTALVGSSSILVTVRHPPVAGTCQITPGTGVVGSVNSDYMVSCDTHTWLAGSPVDGVLGTLLFRVGYTTSHGVDMSLSGFEDADSFTFRLPVGSNHVVFVEGRDHWGSIARFVFPAITVALPSGSDADVVRADVIKNFAALTQRATEANSDASLVAGMISTVLSLATRSGSGDLSAVFPFAQCVHENRLDDLVYRTGGTDSVTLDTFHLIIEDTLEFLNRVALSSADADAPTVASDASMADSWSAAGLEFRLQSLRQVSTFFQYASNADLEGAAVLLQALGHANLERVDGYDRLLPAIADHVSVIGCNLLEALRSSNRPTEAAPSDAISILSGGGSSEPVVVPTASEETFSAVQSAVGRSSSTALIQIARFNMNTGSSPVSFDDYNSAGRAVASWIGDKSVRVDNVLVPPPVDLPALSRPAPQKKPESANVTLSSPRTSFPTGSRFVSIYYDHVSAGIPGTTNLESIRSGILELALVTPSGDVSLSRNTVDRTFDLFNNDVKAFASFSFRVDSSRFPPDAAPNPSSDYHEVYRCAGWDAQLHDWNQQRCSVATRSDEVDLTGALAGTTVLTCSCDVAEFSQYAVFAVQDGEHGARIAAIVIGTIVGVLVLVFALFALVFAKGLRSVAPRTIRAKDDNAYIASATTRV